MLLKVIIKNYILIEELDIDFDSGLNVMTGETGAGKSIILGAIRLALGERSSGNVIRQGADKAVIQIVFVVDESMRVRLSKHIDNLEEMIVFKRELYTNGKSVMRINDDVTTLAKAKQVAELLLNIHGQHDYQHVLDSAGQLALIDGFLDADDLALRDDVKQLCRQLYDIKAQIDAVSQTPEAIEREIELIKFQIDDIDQAALTAADDSVEDDYRALHHAADIIQHLAEARQLIDADFSDNTTLNALMNRLIKALNSVESHRPHYGDDIKQLDDLSFYLASLSDKLRRDMEDLSVDEQAIFAVEKRLDVVNSLKKKYGQTVEAILIYRAALDERLVALGDQSNLKASLNNQYQRLRCDYLDACQRLTVARKTAAEQFTNRLSRELISLHFDDVRLATRFETSSKFSVSGRDNVDIVISLNRGQDLESLKRVASGGEVSRIMLAIKRISASRDAVSVLIFDEIDAGISGVTASVVAEKLYQVARYHQVICITHLSQVALMADRHFLIVKDTSDETAISRVLPLTTSQRESEIARLIAGSHSDASHRQQAAQLLTRADERKLQMTTP